MTALVKPSTKSKPRDLTVSVDGHAHTLRPGDTMRLELRHAYADGHRTVDATVGRDVEWDGRVLRVLP